MIKQTAVSFRDKWEKNSDAFWVETLREGSDTQRWILERNGFGSRDEFAVYLEDRKRILDAGCGNGRVTALLRSLAPKASELVVLPELLWVNDLVRSLLTEDADEKHRTLRADSWSQTALVC